MLAQRGGFQPGNPGGFKPVNPGNPAFQPGNPIKPGGFKPNPGNPAFQPGNPIKPGGFKPNPGNPAFQPGNPGRVNPLPPVFIDQKVWLCPKCRGELGRNPAGPSFDQCPGCGINILNGPNGGRINPVVLPPNNPQFNPGIPEVNQGAVNVHVPAPVFKQPNQPIQRQESPAILFVFAIVGGLAVAGAATIGVLKGAGVF